MRRRRLRAALLLATVAVVFGALGAAAAALVVAGSDEGEGERFERAGGATPETSPRATDTQPRRTTPASPTTTAPTREPGGGVQKAEPLSEASPLTVDGIGPVRVGMSVDDAEAAGVDLEPLGPANGTCSMVEPAGGPSGLRFMVIGETIAVVYAEESNVATLSGVRVGASTDTVYEKYGRLIERQPHEYDPDGAYLVYVPRDGNPNRMVFETNAAGQVTLVRAGRPPEITYVEGCA